MVLHGKHITRGLMGLLLAATLGLSAIAAGVSVEPTADYTRLYFQFDQPAKLQLGGGGRDVILTFDQPVTQNVLGLQPQLDAIANGIQQSADGKQIILNLKKNYRVRQFTSGNSVGVDIMGNMALPKPEPKAGTTPEAKVEPTAEAAPVAPVAVITPPEPKPAVKPEPVKIITPSEKPAVKVITPETLTQIKAKPPEKKLEPVAEPKPGAPEAKVIRVAPPNILTTKKEPTPTPLPAPEKKEEGPPYPEVSPAEAFGPIAAPTLTTKEFAPEPKLVAEAAVETPQPAAEEKPPVKAEEPPPASEEVAAEDEEDEPIAVGADDPFLVGVKPSKDGTELYFPWQERVGSAVFERGNEIWIVFSKEADTNVALLRTVLPKSVIKVDQFGYKGATVLRLLTDGSLHAQVSQPKKSYGWRVTLGPVVGAATLDIPVSGEKDEHGKSYLLLAAFDVAQPIRFFDPTIGDLLIVVPTNELGRGLVNPKTTAELNVLRTPQGIAVASLRDDLTTRHDRTGVILSAKGPLAVSENLPVLTPTAAPVPGASAASTVMIPYDQWYVAPEDFQETLAIKFADMMAAKESGKPAAMLALAQLYMGQSMLPEANGWLEIIRGDYPNYYRDNKLAMLSAAAYLLSGRVQEAKASIDAPELKDFPEAEVWREAISLVEPDPAASQLIIQETPPPEPEEAQKPDAATAGTPTPEPAAATQATAAPTEAIEEEEEEEEVGEVAATTTPESTGTLPTEDIADMPVVDTAKKPAAVPATATTATPAATAPAASLAPATAAAAQPIKREFNFLNYNKAYIRFYPPRIRQKLAIMAADYYLRTGQPEKSVMTYDTLNQDGILEGVQPYAEYMLGMIASSKEKEKDKKQALKIWDRMSRQQEDPYISARARYSAIMLRMKMGELKPLEAAEAIERLRMSWRGDGLERQMLESLIKIYRDEKQYDNTLRSMKYLLQGFPGDIDTLAVTGDMSDLFEELFLNGLADDMPPLKSLGLFYEFRELTPLGERGDEIIQKLADRLAAVDLLDRATQLLEHQIRYRVSGEARARVGARLSLLYMLNKEPKRALEVLEITNYGDMDAQLKLQRVQLTAQALAENARPEEALAMLSNDTTEQGSLLRLDILWGMQDWPNVINAAEDLLGNRANLTEPLSSTETPVLLKLALAYAFEEDPTQLRYLRDYYMALIPEGPYKEIFDFLTNDTTPLDAEDFQLVAKQISRTESFLDTFKTKIAQGRLSDTVK